MFGLRQRHRTRPARTAQPRVRRRLLLPHRRASRSSIGTLLHGVRNGYAVSLHPQETLHPQPPTSALHPCVRPCPPPQHTLMHCARALHQHFHRPPLAIMASDADWPPLPSERRSSAVYQPMVRLPTFGTMCHAYNVTAPATAPLTLTSSTIYYTRPLPQEHSPPEGLGGFLAALKAAGGLDQLAKRAY